MKTHQKLATLIIVIFGSCALAQAQIVQVRPAARATPTPEAEIGVIREGVGPEKRPAQLNRMGRPTLSQAVVLSAADKNTLITGALNLNGLKGNFVALPFATLTARTPYIKDRAALAFYGAQFVESRTFNAGLLDTMSVVSIAVYPSKPRQWFMIDCSIEAIDTTPQTYSFIGGGAAETKTVLKGSGNVRALLAAQDVKWYEIYLVSKTAKSWILHACEVNAAN
jgi:hypothetical protein